ncbi:MAG: glycosyl hydrolase 53 family protein [Bacteroidales bacterium]|nr:glycosyl hydrolase 53 family protein [Bacteroidales bacterium]MBN2764034.1 glycosyl hydrolase 53 family protein [Bacteroidales bacterium]
MPNHIVTGQTFYRGNDLSYVNQMEDCGAVFKENGIPKDVYQIFADHGTNLVRVRLWVDPVWQNSLVQPEGVKLQYSDFEDVKETIARSKAAGMEVMLDFHFSDMWADPGRQVIPSRWLGVANDLAALKDSVYNYTTAVLTELNADSLMPGIVKIGNETNDGILKHTTVDNWNAGGSVSSSWSRHAQLYNAAVQAVRDVSQTTSIKPKIALHCAGLNILSWWYNNIISNGVTDFDIMGFSYYYAWHGGSISSLGSAIRSLLSAHPGYEAMVVETGYLWTTQNYDALGNIVTTPDPAYLPVIPEKQLEYMVDYTREVKRSGGSGVIFWEPAWVSTPCRTPWGQGSSHDHLVFFDPVNTNFMENGGGRWMEPQFYEDLNTVKVIFKVDMSGQDMSKGVYVAGDITGGSDTLLTMADIGDGIYSCFTYLSPGDSGSFIFLNDSNLTASETVPSACALWDGIKRKYTIGIANTTYAYKWGTCDPPGSTSLIFDGKYDSGHSVSGIEIYPNPVNQLLMIRSTERFAGARCEILDLSGRNMMTEYIEPKAFEVEVDVDELPSGLYFLKIKSAGTTTIVKFIHNTTY